jgi:hypothetical protein
MLRTIFSIGTGGLSAKYLEPVVKLLPQQLGIAAQDVHLLGQDPAEGGEHRRRITGHDRLRTPCHRELQPEGLLKLGTRA